MLDLIFFLMERNLLISKSEAKVICKLRIDLCCLYLYFQSIKSQYKTVKHDLHIKIYLETKFFIFLFIFTIFLD